MDERDRALEILRQARDELVQRLCQRVVESGEDILDDAQGYSFAGPIESIYDQLGTKLSNVNAMLSSLQASIDRGAFSVTTDLHAVGPAETYIQADTGEMAGVLSTRSPEALQSATELARSPLGKDAMDKKAKKRIDVLRQKLQKLRQQLSGAKQQMDDPEDVVRLEKEIGEIEAELQKLKES